MDDYLAINTVRHNSKMMLGWDYSFPRATVSLQRNGQDRIRENPVEVQATQTHGKQGLVRSDGMGQGVLGSVPVIV